MDDLWGYTSFNEKLHPYDVEFLKGLGIQQKYIGEKDDFEILRRPYVTFNDLWGILYSMKNLRLHNFSNHRNFY